ncbi:MAG: hypothetical protein ACTSPI_15335, partial [Candidatus Heimdallarchaeaceae archaeon]
MLKNKGQYKDFTRKYLNAKNSLSLLYNDKGSYSEEDILLLERSYEHYETKCKEFNNIFGYDLTPPQFNGKKNTLRNIDYAATEAGGERELLEEIKKEYFSRLEKINIKNEKRKTMVENDYYEFNYEEYLKSEYWKSIREERLKIDNYKCKLCNSHNYLAVHHRS